MTDENCTTWAELDAANKGHYISKARRAAQLEAVEQAWKNYYHLVDISAPRHLIQAALEIAEALDYQYIDPTQADDECSCTDLPDRAVVCDKCRKFSTNDELPY